MAVLGGRGWLGQEIACVAHARGVAVTVVSRTPQPGVVAVDLTNTRSLAETLRGFDIVVNAAGRRLGPPALVHAANAALPDRLGGLAAEDGWRFVHLGSAAEYGLAAGGPAPIAEDRRCEPVTTYARSKLAGTEAVAAWRSRGAEALVARVFNIVGPDLPPDNPIHGLVRQAYGLIPGGPDGSGGPGGEGEGEREIAVGDPTTTRDVSTRRWVAEAVVALALGDRDGPAVVNVCSGRPTTFGDLAWAVARALGLKVRVRDLGWPRGGQIVGDPALLRSVVALPDPVPLDGLARSALALDAPPATATPAAPTPAPCTNGEPS
jgi:NDP-hexose 4-ketoreductase